MFGSRTRRSLAAAMAALTIGIPGGALAGEPVATPAPVSAPASPAPGEKGAPQKEPINLSAVKFTREMAVEVAKQTFEIPADLGEPNASINQGREGASWGLNWATPGKKADRLSISVTVDAMTGEIRGYNRWAQSADDPAPLTYTRAEALKIARTWQEKLAGSYNDQLRFDDRVLNLGYYGGTNASYSFRWDRVSGGYPVVGDGVNIAISARTGEMENYSLNWRPDASFQAPATLLERSQAEAVFQEQVPLQLQYQHFQERASDRGEWRLIYRTLLSFLGIDQEGKVLGPDSLAIDTTPYKELKTVPAPDKPYVAPPKPLSQEEALAVARAATGKTDSPTSAGYNEYGEEKKSRNWQFTWATEGNPDGTNLNVQVDAEKGVVTSLNFWSKWEPFKEGEEPPVKEDEARKIAVAFIRSNRPDLAGNAILMPSNQNQMIRMKLGGVASPTYGVPFMMTRNGIPVADQTASVEVDARTGTVRSFWGGELGFDKDPFPTSEGLLSVDGALKARNQHQTLNLAWVTFWNPEQAGKGGLVESQSQPALVWTTATGLPVQAFDARSGAPLDYDGRDLSEAAKFPQDIAGHFAQREIELLWARGIFELKGGKFNPQETATAAELTRWLILTRGMQPYPAYDFGGAFGGMGAPMAARLEKSEAAAYFGAALQSGILMPDDFTADMAPESPVSRELFVLWAVRTMGFGPVAKMANRIELRFADKDAIGERYANAVAILEGMGVAKGDGRAFYPQRSLNRGEAAKILFAVASQVRR